MQLAVKARARNAGCSGSRAPVCVRLCRRVEAGQTQLVTGRTVPKWLRWALHNLLPVCLLRSLQTHGLCAWSQPLHCRCLGRQVCAETQSRCHSPTRLWVRLCYIHTHSSPPTDPLPTPLQPYICYLGFRSTRMTESPLKNILLMNRSRFTGRPPLAPRPRFGICDRAKRETRHRCGV